VLEGGSREVVVMAAVVKVVAVMVAVAQEEATVEAMEAGVRAVATAVAPAGDSGEAMAASEAREGAVVGERRVQSRLRRASCALRSPP